MKRTFLNIGIWLFAALLTYMLLNVLRSNPSVQPPITAAHTAEMAELLQERQNIEAEIQRLTHEYKTASAAPTSVFIMIHSTEEDVIQEIASIMDPLKFPAIMGVSADMLTHWSAEGLPAYVQERIDAGWELCLLLEEMPPRQMQDILLSLHLNAAIAAYDTPECQLSLSPEELLNCGIRILIEDDLSIARSDDDLWRIASIGNMHSEGIRIYEQYRNTGAALVNIIGHYRADQTYVRENLEGLLELLRVDSQLGLVQCLRLNSAMQYYQQISERFAKAEQEWIEKRTQLESDLQSVIDQITYASSLLNQ